MNPNGTPANLVAAHPGNRNAVRHGLYSENVRDSRVAEVVEELKLVYGVDEEPALSAFADYAGLRFMIEQIDADFEAYGVPVGNARRRHLLDLRVRVSRQLERSRAAMVETAKATAVRIALRERAEGSKRKTARETAHPEPDATLDAADPAVRALMLKQARHAAAAARELYIREVEGETADVDQIRDDDGEVEFGSGGHAGPAPRKGRRAGADPSGSTRPAGSGRKGAGPTHAEHDRATLLSELRNLLHQLPAEAERLQKWLDPDVSMTSADAEVVRAEIEGIRRATTRSAGKPKSG